PHLGAGAAGRLGAVLFGPHRGRPPAAAVGRGGRPGARRAGLCGRGGAPPGFLPRRPTSPAADAAGLGRAAARLVLPPAGPATAAGGARGRVEPRGGRGG